MTALSILELVRVTENTDARGGLDNARDLAAHAERWGYRRIWVAEHHNIPGIASAATSIVLAHIAAGTKTIRVGAGGIMLPNHAPYVIAEQLGTLARLFPGRIDLGLGRAPGTDQLTLRALRRAPEAAGMALSDDLRERVVGAVVEGGMSRNAAAKRFGVSIASAVRWVARFKAKGEISPAPTGGDRRSGRIEAHHDYLLGLIGRRPDMTLLEIQERLIANCGERFSSSVLWRFFDRHEITFKKSQHMPRSSNARMF